MVIFCLAAGWAADANALLLSDADGPFLNPTPRARAQQAPTYGPLLSSYQLSFPSYDLHARLFPPMLCESPVNPQIYDSDLDHLLVDCSFRPAPTDPPWRELETRFLQGPRLGDFPGRIEPGNPWIYPGPMNWEMSLGAWVLLANEGQPPVWP